MSHSQWSPGEATTMRCTVIIPTIGGPHLNDQLAAVARQTRPADQILVVNNGPDGLSTSLLEQWISELPQLQVVEDAGMSSPAYARNVGVSRAEHPALVFLDDDDIADDRYLEYLVPALERHPLVAARIDLDRLNPPAVAERWRGMQEQGPMTHHGYLPWVVSAAMGVRRDVFDAAGGFDSDMRVCEDTDFSWRLALGGFGEPIFESRAVLHYRLKATPTTAFRQALAWSSGEVTLYMRYRDKGFPRPRSPLRDLLRWGRAALALLPWPTAPRRLVASRISGDRLGHLIGSVRERCLYL
jgi:GT2 family glycosyltransferase